MQKYRNILFTISIIIFMISSCSKSDDIQASIDSYELKITELNEAHKKEISNLKQNYEYRIKNLNEQYANQLMQLQYELNKYKYKEVNMIKATIKNLSTFKRDHWVTVTFPTSKVKFVFAFQRPALLEPTERFLEKKSQKLTKKVLTPLQNF